MLSYQEQRRQEILAFIDKVYFEWRLNQVLRANGINR